MENNLDTIEKAKRKWQEIVEEFYKPFEEKLEKVKEEMRDVKIPLKEDTTDFSVSSSFYRR